MTLRRRKSSLKAKRLRMKRKTSFQASEMMKENSNKINGSIQMQQIRVERSPNEMNGCKLISQAFKLSYFLSSFIGNVNCLRAKSICLYSSY